VTTALTVLYAPGATTHDKTESECQYDSSQAEPPKAYPRSGATGFNVPNDEPKNVILDPPVKDDGRLAGDTEVTSGATTWSGSAPLATKYKAVPGFSIAACAIVPTLLPLPSSIAAITLTDGDTWAVAVFVKTKVNSNAVFAAVPPDAAVSTSVPEFCVQAPALPRRLPPDVTVVTLKGLSESSVNEPVSPEIVTVDPVARL